MLQKLIEIHELIVSKKHKHIKRYLFEKINWNAQAICIAGSRGTGKTTMIIQHYHETYGTSEKALYISADHISVISHGLYEIADTYFKSGGQALYIDEIHKYTNWSVELKSIIDVYSDKQIIISGSSTIALSKSKGDLSRRVVYYELKGLSFREFLLFELKKNYGTISLKNILAHHREKSLEIKKDIPVLKYFKNYLAYGYYPFFTEGVEDYYSKLQNVIEKAVYEDIATSFNLSQPKLPVLKKLLWIIAASEPFTPNIDRISRELGVSRQTVYHYIEYLEQAGFILNIKKHGTGMKAIRKPGKIYMENTGLIKAISEVSGMDSITGTIRETFFANQLNTVTSITIPEKTDFFVKNKFSFEIGGKNKSFSQISELENSYLALDDIEVGFGRKIPLYLFGFLY